MFEIMTDQTYFEIREVQRFLKTFIRQYFLSLSQMVQTDQSLMLAMDPAMVGLCITSAKDWALRILERYAFSYRCPIPDDHIAPSRSALFLARSVLRGIRNGGYDANQAA